MECGKTDGDNRAWQNDRLQRTASIEGIVFYLSESGEMLKLIKGHDVFIAFEGTVERADVSCLEIVEVPILVCVPLADTDFFHISILEIDVASDPYFAANQLAIGIDDPPNAIIGIA